MRDIKFRCWHIAQKRWLEDFEFYILPSGAVMLVGVGGEDAINGEPCIEVCQYTGLKDSKRTEEYPEGQEIYEGDIIATYYSGNSKKLGEIYIKREVKWGVYDIGVNGREYDFVVAGPYVEDEKLYGLMIDGYDIEVIGNKYEGVKP